MSLKSTALERAEACGDVNGERADVLLSVRVIPFVPRARWRASRSAGDGANARSEEKNVPLFPLPPFPSATVLELALPKLREEKEPEVGSGWAGGAILKVRPRVKLNIFDVSGEKLNALASGFRPDP